MPAFFALFDDKAMCSYDAYGVFFVCITFVGGIRVSRSHHKVFSTLQNWNSPNKGITEIGYKRWGNNNNNRENLHYNLRCDSRQQRERKKARNCCQKNCGWSATTTTATTTIESALAGNAIRVARMDKPLGCFTPIFCWIVTVIINRT